MNPYFKDKSVKLFLGDSLDLLKKIPPESIDMIFADPPYNLSNGDFVLQKQDWHIINDTSWLKLDAA